MREDLVLRSSFIASRSELDAELRLEERAASIFSWRAAFCSLRESTELLIASISASCLPWSGFVSCGGKDGR